MATNYIQPGECLTFTAPTGGVVSGTPYLIGGLLVVATATVAQTLPFEGCTMGVFTLPKADSQAWTEGALIYWDNTAKNCTTVSTANYRIGVAAAAVASTTGLVTGKVRLNGVGVPAGA
jgi:predicted RecA/RadA family phage recombinase